jgi:archaetidylinositol phosphate synthase
MSEMSNHKREVPMLLGALERPALKWLSEHMPGWITPNIMTIIGMVGSLMIFAGYFLTNYNESYIWLACAGFVVNWFGDSLDGTIARYRNIQRPKFGFYLDHAIDVAAQLLMFTGIGLSIYASLNLALFALIGYLLISILSYLAIITSNVFRIAYISLGPTEMRLIAIATNIVVFYTHNPIIKLHAFRFTLFDTVLIFIIALLYGGALGIMILKLIELNKSDPAIKWEKK